MQSYALETRNTFPRRYFFAFCSASSYKRGLKFRLLDRDFLVLLEAKSDESPLLFSPETLRFLLSASENAPPREPRKRIVMVCLMIDGGVSQFAYPHCALDPFRSTPAGALRHQLAGYSSRRRPCRDRGLPSRGLHQRSRNQHRPFRRVR